MFPSCSFWHQRQKTYMNFPKSSFRISLPNNRRRVVPVGAVTPPDTPPPPLTTPSACDWFCSLVPNDIKRRIYISWVVLTIQSESFVFLKYVFVFLIFTLDDLQSFGCFCFGFDVHIISYQEGHGDVCVCVCVCCLIWESGFK